MARQNYSKPVRRRFSTLTDEEYRLLDELASVLGDWRRGAYEFAGIKSMGDTLRVLGWQPSAHAELFI